MTTTTKTRKQPEITSAAIFRIIDKATGQCLGYGVPSDTEPSVTYFVTWNKERHCYECTCKGGQCATCKHRRAVVSVLAAKKEIARASNLGNFFQALAQIAQQQVAEQAIAEVEKQIAETPTPTPTIETPTSVAVATSPVAATKTAIAAKGTASLRGRVGIGFGQMKNVPTPRKVAVPMR